MTAYSPSGSSNDTVANEMDAKIGSYSRLLDKVPDNERPNLRSKLLSAKLMKEKLVAMTALARAQTILAEMDVLVAENNLKTAFEQLDKFKEQTESAEKKKSAQKPEPKPQPQKEPEKSPKETSKNNSKNQRVSSPADANKENSKERKKATPQIEESQKDNKSRPRTPTTQKSTKRRHSDSSSSKSNSEKKAKKARVDVSAAESSKSTTTPYITKAVQTCSKCLLTKNTESDKNLERVSNRVIEDDESTVLIDELTMEGPKSHRDAINLSQALQKILSPKTAVKAQASRPDDLTRSSVPSKIQLLFEDEPKRELKSCKAKVKTEVPETDLDNSTDNLVNGLFMDIMEAKSKQVSNQPSHCSKPMPGGICKFMLRELLEKC